MENNVSAELKLQGIIDEISMKIAGRLKDSRPYTAEELQKIVDKYKLEQSNICVYATINATNKEEAVEKVSKFLKESKYKDIVGDVYVDTIFTDKFELHFYIKGNHINNYIEWLETAPFECDYDKE